MEETEKKINELETENALLNKRITEIEDNSKKIDEAKDLLLEYNEALKKQKIENEGIKKNIEDIVSELDKLPSFIKNNFIKDEEMKKILDEKK